MSLRWTTWLTIWVAIALAGAMFGGVLWVQGAPGTARGVWLGATLVWAAWLGVGLWQWRHIPRVARVSWLLILTAAAAILLQVAIDGGWTGFAVAVAGAYVMTVGFVGGLTLIRMALSAGHPVTSVARTLIDEAVRMKIAVVFIVALVLLVPMLPVMMDGEEMLKYRLQTFLTWSMMATAVLLGLMTVFLSVATITNEVKRRQIHLTLTKPVSRGQYLAGKWLGVAVLNLLLVAVCGGGIYVFTLMLSQQPARDQHDARSVRQEVLTAREAVFPRPTQPDALQRRFDDELERRRRLEPHNYGEPGAPLQATPQRDRDRIQRQIMRQWLTIDPRERTTYVFDGLERAQDLGGTVQLRIQPEFGSGEDRPFAHLLMMVNDRPFPPPGAQRPVWELAANTSHVLQIPTELIENGQLRILLYNVPLPQAGREQTQPSINFNPEDGLQILYSVGTFEANLVRALALVWLHLAFLAILGLAAGSFLSFPSACLLSLVIYAAGAMTGYIQTSLSEYARMPGEMTAMQKTFYVPQALVGHIANAQFADAGKLAIRACGEMAMALVPSLSRFDPTTHLADGLIVPVQMVSEGVLWMGLIWGGLVALIAWLIFRRRELAQITV